MKKFFLFYFFIAFLISSSVLAKTLEQKKEELKKIYENGGISKIEYKKAIEFLENPTKEEKKEKKILSLKKKKNKTNSFKKDKKDEEVITLEKIEKLGKPFKFDKSYYPESMQVKFKGFINQFTGIGRIAGQFLFKSFNRPKSYQQKNPGELIKAMAMYEIFYATQLWESRTAIERYKKNEYKQILSRKKDDEKKIRSLLGMKKGQKGMREALGMTLETPAKDAIKKFWLLGEFLALGTGVDNEKLSKDLKKRKELIEEYKIKIADLKKKLKDDIDEDDGKDEKQVE